MRISPMKKFALTLAVAVLCTTVAIAAPRYFSVSGAGMGTDTDKSSAHEAADSSAQSNLQNACPGSISQSRKIFDQCSQLGDDWVCNVNYSAICTVGN
jgi:hypothetical protein